MQYHEAGRGGQGENTVLLMFYSDYGIAFFTFSKVRKMRTFEK
jgi:hypothetical protein